MRKPSLRKQEPSTDKGKKCGCILCLVDFAGWVKPPGLSLTSKVWVHVLTEGTAWQIERFESAVGMNAVVLAGSVTVQCSGLTSFRCCQGKRKPRWPGWLVSQESAEVVFLPCRQPSLWACLVRHFITAWSVGRKSKVTLWSELTLSVWSKDRGSFLVFEAGMFLQSSTVLRFKISWHVLCAC